MEYQLPKPFDLSPHETVYLDIETTGFDIYKTDKPIGISVGVGGPNNTSVFRYYPMRHNVGPNHDVRQIYQWLSSSLKNKTIVGHNIGAFDLPALRHDGLNLIGRGNKFRDTMHGAIIHNPDAPGYSLDGCAKRYLGADIGKVSGLDKERLADYHPSEVGSYAEQDTRLCWMLDPVLQGFLRKGELQEVFDLECRTIEPVVEMQENGLLFDHARAKSWIDLAQKDLRAAQDAISGVNPNSGKQMQEACDRMGIVYPWNWKCPTPTCEEAYPDYKHEGQTHRCWRCKVDLIASSPHFGKKFLKHIDHPFVKNLLKAKQLHKLLNTFLIPWVENIDPANPILRFQLHQLRERDEAGASSGAVSGRFSCSGMGEGAQPQQVWSVENQIAEIGDDYILRSLFIPGNGNKFLSADASQIEYRFFAHYSDNADLIKAYNDNPKIDFHQFVADVALKGKMVRKKAKNINFGILYNMGVEKLAREMNVSLKEANEMMAIYNEHFPAARSLRDRCKRMAQIGAPTVTLYGRRFEWPEGRRNKAYVALNRLIQGSAADVMKLALVKAYNGGYFSKMRLTVHDELDGDILSDDAARALKADLEDPAFLDNRVKVPLLWETSIAHNWSGK
jgi:DNA polymerase I-like protein with 3'-5' exonuclease and polymerase domains